MNLKNNKIFNFVCMVFYIYNIVINFHLGIQCMIRCYAFGEKSYMVWTWVFILFCGMWVYKLETMDEETGE